MSLECSNSNYEGEDCTWWWTWCRELKPLSTKRSRKCCSCGCVIPRDEMAGKVSRDREPNSEIEDRIYNGDSISLAAWYVCEKCFDLGESLFELGFSFSLGDGQSLQDQIDDYRKLEAEFKGRQHRAPKTASEVLEC